MSKEDIPQGSMKVSHTLDKIIKGIGHTMMWANGLLVLVIILNVVLRYGFGSGQVGLEELQWHLYSIGIMFGISYAVTLDSHIRVDIIHANLSKKWQQRWDLFGIFFLLLPFAIMVFHQSLDFVYESIRVNERSTAPTGLPFRWLIKMVIPTSFFLLILAVISRVIQIIHQLKKG